VEVEGIPVTANGKVDRRALEERAARAKEAEVAVSAEVSAPREAPRPTPAPTLRADADPLRDTLRAALAEVLDVEQVEDADDFFDLGGDSLRAARLLALVRERTGVEVPLREFYPEPTLERLVSLVSVRRVPPVPGAAAFTRVAGKGSEAR
jgi:acyl carrier protein